MWETLCRELGSGGMAFGGEDQPPYQCLNKQPSEYQAPVPIYDDRQAGNVIFNTVWHIRMHGFGKNTVMQFFLVAAHANAT